jgi:hypothetical protein
MMVDNERPPYVTFERVPVEDRTASIAAGRYVAKEVDFVTITRPGSRDSVVKEAEQYAKELQKRAADGLIPAEWPGMYEAAYKRWREGEEIPVMGTPIKGWQLLSPVSQKALLDAGVRTVEDLAKANEATLAAIGPGGISMKEKAKSWLASAENVGAVVEELNSLRVALEEAQETIKTLVADNKRLLAQLPERKAEKVEF